MESKSILVVDDEIDLCEILRFNLESDGYSVDVLNSAEQVLQKESELNGYSLMLLDVMMEQVSGFDLMYTLRYHKNINIPTIFVTAKTQEDDLLKGFELGADDFIRKPFSPKEVVARVNAVLERINNMDKQKINTDNIYHDSEAKKVYAGAEPVEFTKTEYDIFSILSNKPGKVFSRDEIIDIIWKDQENVLGRTVDVNITRIRKKLGSYGQNIVTRSGYGYYFKEI